MKKIILLSVFLFSCCLFSQKIEKITPKKCIPKKGYHLKLKSVFNDSRCPEGTTCIWAGEVSVIIEVYNDRKFIEDKTLTFNSKNVKENIQWFSTYYSGKIKSVGVLPIKKEGVVVKPEKQYINVVFEN
jgi:hypothetical protein